MCTIVHICDIYSICIKYMYNFITYHQHLRENLQFGSFWRSLFVSFQSKVHVLKENAVVWDLVLIQPIDALLGLLAACHIHRDTGQDMIHAQDENHTLQNRRDVFATNHPTCFEQTFQFGHCLDCMASKGEQNSTCSAKIWRFNKVNISFQSIQYTIWWLFFFAQHHQGSVLVLSCRFYAPKAFCQRRREVTAYRHVTAHHPILKLVSLLRSWLYTHVRFISISKRKYVKICCLLQGTCLNLANRNNRNRVKAFVLSGTISSIKTKSRTTKQTSNQNQEPHQMEENTRKTLTQLAMILPNEHTSWNVKSWNFMGNSDCSDQSHSIHNDSQLYQQPFWSFWLLWLTLNESRTGIGQKYLDLVLRKTCHGKVHQDIDNPKDRSHLSTKFRASYQCESPFCLTLSQEWCLWLVWGTTFHYLYTLTFSLTLLPFLTISHLVQLIHGTTRHKAFRPCQADR